MTLEWIAADMRTGEVITDLPSLQPQYPLRHTISNYDSATATLVLDGAPTDWQNAIRECATWLACFDDGDPGKAIQWCGYPSMLQLKAATDTVDMTLVTAEAYLDRRDTGDVTYAATMARDDIVAASLLAYVVDGAEPGIPLQLAYTAGAGPTPTADLVWQNTDNASELTRLGQVAAQLGGEFAIDWGWSDDGQFLIPTIRFGDRIGTAAIDGLANVTFELPGALLDFVATRDYSDGKGANKLVYYSSGQGTSTPYAAPVLAADFEGRPTFEFRHQPAPSISPAALTQYAQQALPILAPGARTVSMVASLARSAGIRYGIDWQLGDDIGYHVATHDAVGTPILAFPDGMDGIGRCLAIELTDTTITPILAEAEVYTTGDV